MIAILKDLRKVVATGFVGGSDLNKIQEQLGVTGNNGEFDRWSGIKSMTDSDA